MKISVIKIGGNAIRNSSTAFVDYVKRLLKSGYSVVVVHGGGPEVNQWLKDIGIKPKFVNGVRFTDGKTLDVVVSVLAGKMNKEVVSLLVKKNISALGLSGVDGKLVLCRKKGGLGFVGEPLRINRAVIAALLRAGFVPVISSVGIDIKTSGLLNVNADVMADAIARALKVNRLVYVTDVPGVFDDKGKVIKKITPYSSSVLIKKGVIKDGMIPKVRSCIQSLNKGVKEVIITDLKSVGTAVTK